MSLQIFHVKERVQKLSTEKTKSKHFEPKENKTKIIFTKKWQNMKKKEMQSKQLFFLHSSHFRPKNVFFAISNIWSFLRSFL